MKLDSKEIQNYKALVLYSTLGVGTATGLFFLARHFYKKSVTTLSEKHSLEEGDPSTFAKQLKMAFDNDNYFGLGTKEELVFQVFRDIPSKSMYAKVQKEYSRLYAKNLNADLEDELDTDEYNELIRILAQKK
jgi:hypothetical protein